MFRRLIMVIFRLYMKHLVSSYTIYTYIYYLLHRELHVSALDNGHLQVVYETLSKQLYKIYIIYYIENNYVFRRLIMAIFRLYMKHLVSSYTKHIYELLIWGREGVKWARDLVSVLKVGCNYICSHIYQHFTITTQYPTVLYHLNNS